MNLQSHLETEKLAPCDYPLLTTIWYMFAVVVQGGWGGGKGWGGWWQGWWWQGGGGGRGGWQGLAGEGLAGEGVGRGGVGGGVGRGVGVGRGWGWQGVGVGLAGGGGWGWGWVWQGVTWFTFTASTLTRETRKRVVESLKNIFNLFLSVNINLIYEGKPWGNKFESSVGQNFPEMKQPIWWNQW